jgi:FkbM family methyltransferase
VLRYVNLFRNISNWWLHFAVKFSLSSTDPLLFKTRNNVFVEVPRALLHEFKEIFLEECYVRGLGLDVSKRPTIIDVGANAGFFTLFIASRFPEARIFSFEPIENNFKQLRRNRDLNEDCHIAISPKAVFGHSGEISLSFNPNDGFTTAATVLGESDEGHSKTKVPCITLSEIFEKHHIDRCEILKMDCEGSEYSILYNCPSDYLNRIAQMAIEVHRGPEPNQNMESLRRHLVSHGFEMRQSGHMLWAWLR